MKAHKLLLRTFMIIALCYISMSINAKNYPVVQYMTDGSRTFFESERIDSITFSHYDLDSIWNPEIVTHVIWRDGVPDRTLISETDSVSFKFPTFLKENVREINETMFNCITEFDYNNFGFCLSKQCPEELIPYVGERLYTLTMGGVFPVGFMGEVNKVTVRNGVDENQYFVSCSPVDYDDIFESFYGKYSRTVNSQRNTENPDSITISKKAYINSQNEFGDYVPELFCHIPIDVVTPVTVSGFDFETDNEVFVKLTPTFTVNDEEIITSGHKQRTVSVSGEMELKVVATVSGNASKEFKFPVIEPKIPIPVAPMLNMYFETGPMLNFAVENLRLHGEITDNICFNFSAVFNDDKLEEPTLTYTFGQPVWIKDQFAASGKGSVDIGAYIELGVETVAESVRKRLHIDDKSDISLGRVFGNFAGGLRFAIDAEYTQEDWDNSASNTNLYNALSKPDNFSAGLFGEFGVGASVLIFEIGKKVPIDIEPFYKSALLPHFYSMEVDSSSPYIEKVSAIYGPNLLCPPVSFCAFDITEDPNSLNVVACSDNITHTSPEGGMAVGGFNLNLPNKRTTYSIQPYMQYKSKFFLADPKTILSNEADIVMNVTDTYFKCDERNYGYDNYYQPIIEVDLKITAKNGFPYKFIKFVADPDEKYYDIIFDESGYAELKNVKIDISSSHYVSNKSMTDKGNTYSFSIPVVYRLYKSNGSSRRDTTIVNYSCQPSHTISNIQFDPVGDDYCKITANSYVEGLMAYYLADKDNEYNHLISFMGRRESTDDPNISILKDGDRVHSFSMGIGSKYESSDFTVLKDTPEEWIDLIQYYQTFYCGEIAKNPNSYVYTSFEPNYNLPSYQIIKCKVCKPVIVHRIHSGGNEEIYSENKPYQLINYEIINSAPVH